MTWLRILGQLVVAGAYRAGRRLVVALSLMGLLLAGPAACTNGGTDDPSPSPRATGRPTPAPTVFTSPPDGGTLTVVEAGFSTVQGDGETPGAVSYGVIIENASGAAALNSFVSIWLIDSAGERIGGPASGEPSLRARLTRLLPGERVGVGATEPSYDGEVADLQVEVEAAAEWVSPLGSENWLLQPVVARDVATERGADSTTIAFTVDAGYTSEMVPGGLGSYGEYVAIFRDAAGAVVGGAGCCAEPVGAAEVVTPGQSREELHLDHGVPARADDARTEVYVLLG